MGSRVEVVDVVKVYESRAGRVIALREVSLTVEPGEVVAVMGPSGSGKTTLLNLIGGLDKPTAGKVLVDGVEVSALPEDKLREYRLHRVGYVFQQHNLVPTLTALENVLLPMSLAGRRDERKARQLLAAVGLAGKENRLPEELSGGEQQRLAIAVALANDPPLLLADEPTGELDIATGERIVKLLLAQSREHGKTIIMTTHDPRVARMADRVVLLEDGRLRGSYSPRRIAAAGPAAEVEAERIIVEHLRTMLADVRRKLQALEEEVKTGKTSLPEAVAKYQRLRALEEALVEELARLGAGVEATAQAR